MQGSQEGKRAKLWGPRAHFGANISMKIVYKSLPFTEKRPRKPETLNVPLRPEIFLQNDRKSRVPFTFQSDFPELTFCKW